MADAPASTRRTSLGQATGGRALRLMRPTVATMWRARRENQISRCPRTRRFWGDPARHNPEDLLVVAISSCHMLWYLHLCANAGIIVRAYEDCPIGRLLESPESGGHFESVVLRPKVTIESGDVQEALRLHHDAHKKCFIASSVNFPVLLEPAIQHTSKA
jgi:organic hydroperoxide reductase OsmC/OhrA